MDISGNGRGSNTLTGWFSVTEVAYGPTGEVLVFAATFEQHSEGHDPRAARRRSGTTPARPPPAASYSTTPTPRGAR